TRSLAIELAPKGILVNGIMPGVTDTKSFRAVSDVDKVLGEAMQRTATGRLCSPEDGANVAAFLCSNQASMICGQFIIIDGGTFILG
ncbi:MAG: SDR family oxidoreductase, partial [bacterium]|nr:SDR family oxidoreductase [bacterium]